MTSCEVLAEEPLQRTSRLHTQVGRPTIFPCRTRHAGNRSAQWPFLCDDALFGTGLRKIRQAIGSFSYDSHLIRPLIRMFSSNNPQPILSLFFFSRTHPSFLQYSFFDTISTHRFIMKIVVQYFLISALIVGSAKAQCRLADNCNECLNIANPSDGDGRTVSLSIMLLPNK